MCFSSIMGTWHEDKVAVTYVTDTQDTYEAVKGAKLGINDNNWATGYISKKDPTENSMNNYFKNYEFVFFAGHGDPDEIGGNQNNGFSGNWMIDSELDSNLNTKVVTLMSCESLQDFGDELIKNGVECVVGWNDLLSTSNTKSKNWAKYFYKCSGWHDPDYCEDYAMWNSALTGSSTKGDCNSFGMNSNTSKKYRNINLDNYKSEKRKLKNGIIFSDYLKYLNKNENVKNLNKDLLNKEESLKIAKNFLDIPKNYKLENIEIEENNINVLFQRYEDDIKISMDVFGASINRYTNQIYMYRKTKTDDLPVLKEFNELKIDKNKILNSLEKNAKIISIQKALNECENEKLCKSYQIKYSLDGVKYFKILDAINYKQI